MEIRQLRYFTEIVEEGTITAAARKLHMSQPPLSFQIRQLEEELGTILFERGARQIKLTEAGRTLYRYAVEMLELEHTACDDIRNLTLGKKGSVRIGMVSSAASRELLHGVKHFADEHPQVQLLIFDANTSELLEMLRREKIELAFIRTPYPTHDFETAFVRRDSMCAVGMPDMLKGKGNISLKSVSSYPLITYRRREPLIRSALNRLNLPGSFTCITDDARSALMLAQNRLGIAVVPESPTAAFSGMKIRCIDSPQLVSDLTVIKRKDALVSQSANELFQIFSNPGNSSARLPANNQPQS